MTAAHAGPAWTPATPWHGAGQHVARLCLLGVVPAPVEQAMDLRLVATPLGQSGIPSSVLWTWLGAALLAFLCGLAGSMLASFLRRRIRHGRAWTRSWQRRYLRTLNALDYPAFVANTQGMVVLQNRQAQRLSAVACGDGNDAPVEIARLGVGPAAASSMGEVRVGGRTWQWLRVPAPAVVPGAGAHSVLCLMDPEAGDAGRDRAALRHIAHDLRSPLTTMLALIEERSARLHERPASPARPHGEDLNFLEELRRQADYSLRLSRDFLQISRAERLDRGSFVPVNLEDVVAEAVDQLWMAAKQRSIRLVGPVGQIPDPWIQGNPAMLVRAVANVLDNALKYSAPQTEVAAWVRCADDGRLVLRVIDQGIGIDEADLPHLFDPFFQAGGATGAMRSGPNMGVGLGLAFVRCVVERHGGEISVASRVGHGTEVSLLLPRS